MLRHEPDRDDDHRRQCVGPDQPERFVAGLHQMQAREHVVDRARLLLEHELPGDSAIRKM
jgi:hypothetical protein